MGGEICCNFFLSFTKLKIIADSELELFFILLARCSLGDVTNNDACYEKALEVSNGRSARAKVAFTLHFVNPMMLMPELFSCSVKEAKYVLGCKVMA